MSISREEAIAWSRDRCTVKLLESLEDNCKMIMNNWGNKAYTDDTNVEVSALKNAEMLGELRAYKSLAKKMADRQAIPYTMEVSDNA